MFSAWQRVDRNAQRLVENHGFDGDWRVESLVTMGVYLSSREDRVVFVFSCMLSDNVTSDIYVTYKRNTCQSSG